MAKKEKLSLLQRVMSSVFPFYNPDDNSDAQAPFEYGSSIGGNYYYTQTDTSNVDHGSTVNTGKPTDKIYLHSLPHDRFAQYHFYKKMEADSTIYTAIELHLAHALSANNKSGQIVYLTAKNPDDAKYVDQLNKELMTKINESIVSWSWAMAIYGVNYVRPYAEHGKGITHFEANYYTLPHNIREYERAGQLIGFTSEHMQVTDSGEQIRLAEPWTLIPLKIPTWRPNMQIEPNNYTGNAYSLFSDAHARVPIETQNYGTSLLYSSFETWTSLRNAIKSLDKSRQNASIIDRLITVNVDNLDAARAAEYLRLVASQMQADRQAIERDAMKEGYLPTVTNSIIPSMSGGAKGGVSIDTSTVDPNISHIEDIMFQIKRLGGSLGIDPSMLGFSDLLSGGLGEGGFFRTAVQAAMRANAIRQAVINFVHRAIDIHTAFRDGKVWSDGEQPFEIKFNSLNTAIELESQAASEQSANFSTLVVTLLDQIEQSSINQSDTLKHSLYQSILTDLDADQIDKILAELKTTSDDEKGSEEETMMESNQDSQRYVRNQILKFMQEVDNEEHDNV